MNPARLLPELLVGPAQGRLPAQPRALLPLAAATVAALLLAAAVAPRLDVAPAVTAALDADPGAAELSPHDREVRLEQARKLAMVGAWGRALAGPTLRALAVAAALALAFRLAGARPRFAAAFGVAAWGLWPLGLRDLAALPAALRADRLSPEAAGALLPSSLAALGPPAAAGPLWRAAGGLELFALWAAALLAVGMAPVAGVRPRRAAAVVATLFAAQVLLLHLALPGLAAGKP